MKKENRKMAQILLGKEVTASLNEEIEEKVKKVMSFIAFLCR